MIVGMGDGRMMLQWCEGRVRKMNNQIEGGGETKPGLTRDACWGFS